MCTGSPRSIQWILRCTYLGRVSIENMPPIVLTADEQTTALERGGADLRYAMDSEEVPSAVQAIFYHLGVTTIPKLASFAENIPDLKAVLRADFGLDTANGVGERVTIGSICVVFSKAGTRASKQAEIEGELDSKRLAKPLPASDFTAMRRTWEAKWWVLTDRWVPARTYLEKRADELEQGELRAEPLTEVLCRDEDQQDLMVPVWNNSGALTMRKTSHQVPSPANSEQLRYRITIMGTCTMFLGLRHSNRAFLQGLNPQLFADYLEYLLGDFVWLLTAKSADGCTMGAPGWNQVIAYDYQIRKKAFNDVLTTGIPLKDALPAAWKCPITKERYFTTPLALASVLGASTSTKRLSDDGSTGGTGETKSGRGGGRGRGRGKGEGKGRGGKGRAGKGGKGGKGGKAGGCAAKTPDGRSICFNFNNPDSRCGSSRCNFLHVCGLCFSTTHALFQCTGNAGRPAGETQGVGNGTS